MKTTTIGGGIETTVLGFGCASLFRLPSARDRRRVLDAAYDAGIRHYDVAPMYGLGAAEGELAAFARAHADGLVLATKFGIEPTLVARGLARLQSPLRRLLAQRPSLQRTAQIAAAGPRSGLAGGSLYRSSGYNPAAAATSLERSLRRLGRDHIDLLLLHDPTPESVHAGALGQFLSDARARGTVRAWGVAGPLDDALVVGRALGPQSVLQVPFDGFDRTCTPDAAAWPAGIIRFGVLRRAMSRIIGTMDERQRRRWSSALGIDLADPGQTAILLLRDALTSNLGGVVLYSTTNVERVVAAARVAESADDGLAPDRLAGFRTMLSEIGVTPGHIGVPVG